MVEHRKSFPQAVPSSIYTEETESKPPNRPSKVGCDDFFSGRARRQLQLSFGQETAEQYVRCCR